jgi:hypothetical protein
MSCWDKRSLALRWRGYASGSATPTMPWPCCSRCGGRERTPPLMHTHTHTQISKHRPVVTIARSSTRTHADATLHPQGRTNERAVYVCLCICMSVCLSLSLSVCMAVAVRWDGSRSFARRSSSCMRMARRPCLPVWSAWPRSTSRRSASSSAASRPSPVRCACLHSPHHT